MSKPNEPESNANGASCPSRCYRSHPLRVRRTRIGGEPNIANAVYVGRPSKWGNPYRRSEFSEPGGAVDAFRLLMETEEENIRMIQSELRGRILSCWCPLDKPCHADVLAEIANR